MVSSLKLIGTPLGNIRDISLRAMEEIERADCILAEDTRQSLKLIRALGLNLKQGCRLVSCNSQSEQKRISAVVKRLSVKEQVIFLSDAGCPVISDPGSLLVQGVLDHGFMVEVIPGPSAHSAALMGAGIDTTRFAFLGFLPKKKSARKDLIEPCAKAGLALIFYESPRRVDKLLVELFELLGPRRVVVAREITKLYETFHRGKLGAKLDPPVLDKGECVVVVEASMPSGPKNDLKSDVPSFIKAELLNNTSAKDVAALVANTFDIKRNAAYQMVLQQLGS